MTTVTTAPSPAAADAASDPASRSRCGSAATCSSAHRSSPQLLAIAGTVADPGTGTTGEEMNRIYTDNPDPLQWKSFLFHWSYAFWIAPALLLAPYVRGRGRLAGQHRRRPRLHRHDDDARAC